jgi:hypothetical protein
MTTNRRDTLVGVFQEATQAQEAVRALQRAGFSDEQIGVMSKHHSETDDASDERGTLMEEGAVTGLATGAGVGALWGLGIMAGLLPGIGPAIAGGTLGVMLSSAAAGAAAAGIAGALVGLGIPEEEAHFYEKEFKAGRSIVTVHTGGRHADAVAILSKCGACDVCNTTDSHDAHAPLADAMSPSGHLASVPSDHETHSVEIPVRAADVVVEQHADPAAMPSRGGDFRMPVEADEVRIGDHGDVIISRPKTNE